MGRPVKKRTEDGDEGSLGYILVLWAGQMDEATHRKRIQQVKGGISRQARGGKRDQRDEKETKAPGELRVDGWDVRGRAAEFI